MGRKESRLIPFVKQALLSKKYSNLRILDVSLQIFVLDLPRKTVRLDKSCQHILKDWNQLNGRDYNYDEDYSVAKQGMEAALRKSDFLLHIQSGHKKSLIYRILTDDEVKEKKLKRRPLKKNVSVSSPDSGYGSGLDGNPLGSVDVPSPKSDESSNGLNISSDNRKNHTVWNTIHDHDYAMVHCPEGENLEQPYVHDFSLEVNELINNFLDEFAADLDEFFTIANDMSQSEQKQRSPRSSGSGLDENGICLNTLYEHDIGNFEVLEQVIGRDDLLQTTSFKFDDLLNDSLDESLEDLDDVLATNNMSQNDVEPMQLHSSQDFAMDSQLSGNSAPTFLTFETQMFGSSSCLMEGVHWVD